ncbi:hypothetical protein [Pandoravirus japonicus]|uniref:Uncharacterized protein n=1 Tax=Pandoravirus japonicus TaxID=2823154 RepID=A0A811BS07_9VIRU|nr:hypothetical protein [Pandoravirus japonicus]
MAGVGRFFFLRLSLSFLPFPFDPSGLRWARADGPVGRTPHRVGRAPCGVGHLPPRHTADVAAMATVMRLSAILGLPLFCFPSVCFFFFCLFFAARSRASAGMVSTGPVPHFFLRKCAPATKTTNHRRSRDVPGAKLEKKEGVDGRWSLSRCATFCVDRAPAAFDHSIPFPPPQFPKKERKKKAPGAVLFTRRRPWPR